MTILKPIKKSETVSISAKFPKHLKNEINDYCTLAGIETMQDFLIQASEYVLSKDKDWVKHKKDNNL
ncbi:MULTISPECIES: hypothetical protein [Cysteiniphilum]|uniref:Uncharacterized protein n=1 Tax=Cysteiniphilum litorale TaxID=2056700 RepID=A0A8J2Z625_9GAMM|nr:MULTISPECIES: hypothetical protein [Cysteiniphilum]GGG04735.1 hypothetical protein GCM10010995_22700 [Cysteiniphilum litorale]